MKMMSLRLVLIAACAFVWEVTYTLYLHHFGERNLLVAILFSMLIPFASLLSAISMIEAENNWQRVILTAAGAVGFGLGTLAVMLVV